MSKSIKELLKDDWRFTNQDRYLKGVVLRKKIYKSYSDSWDHDHCEFCWNKFMEDCLNLKDCSTSGYNTKDGKRWICKECFEDFKDLFEWDVK